MEGAVLYLQKKTYHMEASKNEKNYKLASYSYYNYFISKLYGSGYRSGNRTRFV